MYGISCSYIAGEQAPMKKANKQKGKAKRNILKKFQTQKLLMGKLTETENLLKKQRAIVFIG